MILRSGEYTQCGTIAVVECFSRLQGLNLPTYFYKAIDKAGKIVTGNTESLRKEDVEATVQSNGLTLIKVEESSRLRLKACPVSLLSFFKQLSILLNQHITLKDALEIMLTIETKRSGQKFLAETLASIKAGSSFAEAISKFPHFATSYIIGSLERAEQTGNMGQTCEMLAKGFETQNFLKKQTRKALTYPMCVLVVTLCLMVMMLQVVIPNVRSFVEEESNWIFVLSDLSIKHPHTCAVLALSFVGAGYVLWRKIRTKFSAGSNYNSVLWLNSLAILLQSGIPLKSALALSNSQTQDKELNAAITEIIHNVVNGEPMHVALQRVKCIPRSAAKFAEIGNACGLLGGMLAQCANIEMQRLLNKYHQRIALLQPLLLGVLGVFLITIIFAIFRPLYDNLPTL